MARAHQFDLVGYDTDQEIQDETSYLNVVSVLSNCVEDLIA